MEPPGEARISDRVEALDSSPMVTKSAETTTTTTSSMEHSSRVGIAERTWRETSRLAIIFEIAQI